MESLGANRAKKLMQELWCKDDAATASIRGCREAEGADFHAQLCRFPAQYQQER